MSKSTTASSIHDERDSPNKPKAIVAIGGVTRDIVCSYENCDIVFEDQFDGLSATQVFNVIRNKKEYDLFVYLSHEYSFTDSDSLSKLIDWFWQSNKGNVGAAYTDALIKQNNKLICYKTNPTYNVNLFKYKTIINTPFIVKADIVPSFNDSIKHLYLWDGILNLMQNTMLFHMPHPIFTISDAMDTPDVSKDIEQINELYYKTNNHTNKKAR